MVERELFLYRKIILSDRAEGRSIAAEGRSIAAEGLRLGSLGGESLHRDDDEYLSFINRVFLNITKHLKN